MALVLCEHVGAEEKPDLLRVIKMALIHDLVEIDAGDTYCYDEKAGAGKESGSWLQQTGFSHLAAGPGP